MKKGLLAMLMLLIAAMLAGETVTKSGQFELSAHKSADDASYRFYILNLYNGANTPISSGDEIKVSIHDFDPDVLGTNGEIPLFRVVYETEATTRRAQIRIEFDRFEDESGKLLLGLNARYKAGISDPSCIDTKNSSSDLLQTVNDASGNNHRRTIDVKGNGQGDFTYYVDYYAYYRDSGNDYDDYMEDFYTALQKGANHRAEVRVTFSGD